MAPAGRSAWCPRVVPWCMSRSFLPRAINAWLGCSWQAVSANPGGPALDEPVEPASGGRYGPDIEPRLSRVELDVRDLKDTQADLKSIVARIEAKLDAVLPYLATKIGRAHV